MRERDHAVLNHIHFCCRCADIKHEDGLYGLIHHRSYGAKYFNFIERSREVGLCHHLLKEFKFVVMHRDKKHLHLLRRFCAFGKRLRKNEPIKLHFGDGHRNIFARLKFDHRLLFVWIIALRQSHERKE